MMAASDLDWMGWCVVATVAVALIIMGGDWVAPDIVFTALIGFYMAAGIVLPSKASLNYGNTGLLTVIKLYMVAEGIYQTGGLESIMVHILGRSRSPFWGLVRLMIPCMVLSAFLNNTPVVALLTPIVISWARRTGVPAKKLLIPLSYASVFGGTITLIGTSTNLVVAGAQQQRYQSLKQLQDVQFQIFDIAPYGVPYAIWGFLFVILTQRWLLPGNSSKYATNITMGLRVSTGSPAAGQTIASVGLHKLQNTVLVGVARKGVYDYAAGPLTELASGDVVYLTGEVDTILVTAEELGLDLVNNESEEGGYSVAEQLTSSTSKFHRLVEVTIPPTSPVVGLSVRQARLREHFDVAVVGVQRHVSVRRDGKLNDVVIQAGDIILFDEGAAAHTGSKQFHEAFSNINIVREAQTRFFVVPYRVTSGDVAGKTLRETGLRGIPGIYIVALDANGDPAQRQEPVDHHSHVGLGDTLWAAADLSGVTFLSKFPGLAPVQQDQVDRSGVKILDQQLTQVVIAATSPLVGRTVVDVRFRQKFRAAVIAYQREGHLAPVDIRQLVLQPGDVLLMSTSEDWTDKYKHDRNFVLVADVDKSAPPKKNRALIAIFLGISMVLTQIIPGVRNEKEWINLWPGAILTAMLMILTGCMSGKQARESILWDVYLTIAAAFGVSNAMEGTGVASEFAQVFIRIARKIGSEGAGLTAVYIATALLSEILTNNAAGAIMYPIAAIAADQLGIAPRKMSIAIMLGASAGFINPFSYQCNLMVYVAGNYRTREFAKVGAPLQAYLLIVAGFILNFMDDWHLVWIVSWVVMGAVIAVPAAWAVLPVRWTQAVEESFENTWTRLVSLLGWRRRDADSGDGVAQRRDSAVDLQAISRSSSVEDAASGIAGQKMKNGLVELQVAPAPAAGSRSASGGAGSSRSHGSS